MPTLARCIFVLAVLVNVVPASAASPRIQRFDKSPVFFEMFSEEWAESMTVDLFREGKVRLHPLGVASIEGFDWLTHPDRKDLSWWVRMERFDYMLPVFDSDSDLDRDLARSWVTRWLDAHETNHHPNKGSRDAMSIGIRAMVLTRYLRDLTSREPDDTLLAGRIAESLRWQQEFLAKPSQFNTTSNHGFWEAMGLLETTRVVPDPEITKLALSRLLTMVGTAVSTEGIELEHAVGYHFHVLKWVSEFLVYLQSFDDLNWEGLESLTSSVQSMRDAAYFLCDQDGNLPQIGDTDARRLAKVLTPGRRGNAEPYLFDKQAGFALFKDPVRSRLRRYVAFSVQNSGDVLRQPFHAHNDVLSVYFSYDGEVILGDAGRYTYDPNQMRNYFTSSSAHNTITSETFLAMKSGGVTHAEGASLEETKDYVRFVAAMPRQTITRSVTLPFGSPTVLVSDEIRANAPQVALWHLGCDVTSVGMGKVERSGEERVYPWVLRTKKGHEYRMTIRLVGANSAPVEVDILKGVDNPLMGWWSPSYARAWPVPVIVVHLASVNSISMITEIQRVR